MTGTAASGQPAGQSASGKPAGQSASGQSASGQSAGGLVLAGRAWLICRLVWRAAPATMLAMSALTLAAGLAPTANAWLIRAVLDAIVPAAAHAHAAAQAHAHAALPAIPARAAGTHIAGLAVALGLTGLVSAVLPHGRRYGEAEMRRRLSLLVEDRVFRAINAYPGMSRFESPGHHDKIRIVQQISNNVPSRLVSAAMTIGQSVITVVGMFLTLAVISPVLAAIVAATAVPATLAQISNGRHRAEHEWRTTARVRRQFFYSRLLSEREAAKEVRLFGLGDFLRGRMLAEMRDINRGEQVLDRRIVTIESLLAVLIAGISAGGLVWTVTQAAAGRLPIGDVTMFAIAIVGVQGALASLLSRLADLYQSLLLFGHYVDVVTAGPDLPLAEPPRPLRPLTGQIEIRDVWFRYADDHPWVLRGVNMTIPCGSSVALVGLNGAGKSTLVKLLCRLYDPVRGSIRWDGVDIRDVGPEQLRARIGAVFQDYASYDLTAAENIGVGDLNRMASQQAVRCAARQAGLDTKIASLPRGYATMLSRSFTSTDGRQETGVMLSGGEWQRLALARGLMRADRDLLILDEPSAGLDAEAEQAIHRRLRQIRAGRTSLLISHRLGSIRDADMIVVLSGGQIIESGRHGELLASAGEYHRLFALQASGYQRNGHGLVGT